MKMVKLGEVARIRRQSVDPQKLTTDCPYVGLEHIDQHGMILYAMDQSTELKSTKFSFKEEDVLFGKLRPYLKKIGISKTSGICSTDILPIEADRTKLDPFYLLYNLRRPKIIGHLTSQAVGVNLPRVNAKTLVGIQIPLPDLATQKKIVAILRKVDHLRSLCQEALGKIVTLGQTVLPHLLNDRMENISWSNLKDITSQISSGITPKGGQTRYQQKGDVLFLRSLNIKQQILSLKDAVYIDFEAESTFKRTRLKKNDILFNITGEGTLGRCCMFHLSTPANVNQHVALIRIKEQAVLPQFVCLYLSSPNAQKDIESKQNGGTRKALNYSQVGSIRIPIPSRDFQGKIVDLTQKLKANRDSIQAKLQELNTLFDVLLQEAFEGDLDFGQALERIEALET